MIIILESESVSYVNVSSFCSRSKCVKLSLSTGVSSLVKLMGNSVFMSHITPVVFSLCALLWEEQISSICEPHYQVIIVKPFPCPTMRWTVRICALGEMSHLTWAVKGANESAVEYSSEAVAFLCVVSPLKLSSPQLQWPWPDDRDLF